MLTHFYERLLWLSIHFYEGLFGVAKHFYERVFVLKQPKAISFIQHYDAPCRNQCGTDERLQVDGFFQEEEGEADGDDHAQLVDRGYTAHVAKLYRLEIEEPRQSCGASRQDEKEPRMGRDALHLGLVIAHEHDAPGNQEDNRSADGSSQVRVDVFHSHFGEDCRQCGKEG